MTRAELAAALTAADAPCDEQTIKRWERGVTPYPRNQRAVCAVLGTTPAELGWEPAGPLVDHLAAVQAALRRAEDETGARPVLPVALAQARMVDALAKEARGAALVPMLREAAQWSQFTAWLHADSALPVDAERWYLRAGGQAREAGDVDMASTILSMRSHLAWGEREPGLSVGLAEGALSVPRLHPATRSQAAQQLARGLAMLHDSDHRVDRLLDEAEDAAHAAAADPDGMPPWLYFHNPARTRVQRAIAYTEAGRGRDAAQILTEAIDRTRPEEIRDRGWNYGRLSLAWAMAGEPDAALDAARQAAAITEIAPSAHTSTELRHAAQLLAKAGARRESAEIADLGRTMNGPAAEATPP
jgi:tetratricopeptide (TPR) repeat protein